MRHTTLILTVMMAGIPLIVSLPVSGQAQEAMEPVQPRLTSKRISYSLSMDKAKVRVIG